MAMVEKAREGREKLLPEICKVIIGQHELLDQVLIALFADFNALLAYLLREK